MPFAIKIETTDNLSVAGESVSSSKAKKERPVSDEAPESRVINPKSQSQGQQLRDLLLRGRGGHNKIAIERRSIRSVAKYSLQDCYQLSKSCVRFGSGVVPL